MRIFSLITSLAESGGAEMLVRNLSLEFSRRGHICHVAYIADARSLNASPEFEAAFKAQLDTAGITYSELGNDGRRNLLKGALAMRRAIRAFDPDVVHIHPGYGLLFQAIGMIRRPTVYTHHNMIFKFPVQLFRIFDRFVSRYIGICTACAELLRRHVHAPVALIPNGVPQSFTAGTGRTVLPSTIEILSVGNLTVQKDYGTLIEAAALLVPRFAAAGRHVRFRIAGEGEERAALERAIADHGLESEIELLGTRSDIAALMQQSTLLVMTSRYEGLPLTLIEAAMSGLPAVATDVGGCSDVVRDGQNGTLVQPGSPDAIAEAVWALLTDGDRYVDASASALSVGREYTLDTCATAHLALFEEITGSPRRRSGR